MPALLPEDALRGAPLAGSRHFLSMRLVSIAGDGVQDRTGQGEALLLLLAGTADASAGGSSWIGRGLRATVFEGRPSAFFLPPGCPWHLARGPAEALLVEARVPEHPATPKAEEALARKVLLPLAGSGKAWDPATGDWRRQEDFALAPEALLPRRIPTIEVDGRRVEVLLAASYKAAALCAAEAVLGEGEALVWPDFALEGGGDGPSAAWDRDTLLLARTEGEALASSPSGTAALHGDAAALHAGPGPCRVEAVRGRCYVAAFFAGPDKERVRFPTR